MKKQIWHRNLSTFPSAASEIADSHTKLTRSPSNARKQTNEEQLSQRKQLKANCARHLCPDCLACLSRDGVETKPKCIQHKLASPHAQTHTDTTVARRGNGCDAPAHLHMALDKHGSRSTHGAHHMILAISGAGKRRPDLSLRPSKMPKSGQKGKAERKAGTLQDGAFISPHLYAGVAARHPGDRRGLRVPTAQGKGWLRVKQEQKVEYAQCKAMQASSCLQLHTSLMESMLSKADLHLAEHATQADLSSLDVVFVSVHTMQPKSNKQCEFTGHPGICEQVSERSGVPAPLCELWCGRDSTCGMGTEAPTCRTELQLQQTVCGRGRQLFQKSPLLTQFYLDYHRGCTRKRNAPGALQHQVSHTDDNRSAIKAAKQWLCRRSVVWSSVLLYQKCCCLEQQRSQKSKFIKHYEYGEKQSKFDALGRTTNKAEGYQTKKASLSTRKAVNITHLFDESWPGEPETSDTESSSAQPSCSPNHTRLRRRVVSNRSLPASQRFSTVRMLSGALISFMTTSSHHQWTKSFLTQMELVATPPIPGGPPPLLEQGEQRAAFPYKQSYSSVHFPTLQEEAHIDKQQSQHTRLHLFESKHQERGPKIVWKKHLTASEPAGVRLGRFPPISEDRIAQGSTETLGEDSRTWKPASPTASTGASVGPEGHTGGAVGALQAPTPMGQGLGTMGPALAAARSGCFEPYEPWFAKQLDLMQYHSSPQNKTNQTKPNHPIAWKNMQEDGDALYHHFKMRKIILSVQPSVNAALDTLLHQDMKGSCHPIPSSINTTARNVSCLSSLPTVLDYDAEVVKPREECFVTVNKPVGVV
ncbi:hypothetical protein Anapl_03616 [Anas platyrhynchos]|uniref:Uncharacterized protein n=1 Tax=Anas platyrhynchos TaxID=8839 RepID=R0M451_ANAPL|nr:hypothetical protein Anapl_03616 [Anas platyrhynchos]